MRQLVVWAGLLGFAACRGGDQPGPSRVQGAVASVGLGEAVRVTSEGYYLAPRFSPDGRHLLFTRPKYSGLLVAEVSGQGQPIVVSEEDYVGWAAKWTEDGIETRTMDGMILVFRDPLGERRRVETGRFYDPKTPSRPVHAYHESDAIHLVRDGADAVISDGQDRYFAPRVSPDGKYVVYEGLVGGLRLYEVATGRTTLVGRGNHPAWLPDSSAFLYDVTEDNGERLTAGDLYAYPVPAGPAVRLTATPDRIETHPSVSRDGRQVAFESQGTLYVAPLRWSR